MLDPTIDILLREYDALYRLVTFRMASLDRRIPLIGAALTAFLPTLIVMPSDAQTILLCELPVVLVWLLRTTVNHACSFEDALRRIEEIELAVNRIAGAELLAFQSRHPSRGRFVGGRTGAETVGSTFTACLLLLTACAYVATITAPFNDAVLYLYLSYLGTVFVVLLNWVVRDWRGYRYVKRFDLAAPRA